MSDSVKESGFLTLSAVRRLDGIVHVTGTVMAYTPKPVIKVKALPLGIIGSTFRLGVTVTEVPGPMKGQAHPFPPYDIPADQSDQFTRVSVETDDDSAEVEITTLPDA